MAWWSEQSPNASRGWEQVASRPSHAKSLRTGQECLHPVLPIQVIAGGFSFVFALAGLEDAARRYPGRFSGSMWRVLTALTAERRPEIHPCILAQTDETSVNAVCPYWAKARTHALGGEPPKLFTSRQVFLMLLGGKTAGSIKQRIFILLCRRSASAQQNLVWRHVRVDTCIGMLVNHGQCRTCLLFSMGRLVTNSHTL